MDEDVEPDNSIEFDSIIGTWLDSASKVELYPLIIDDLIVHSGQWVIIIVVSNVEVSVETIIDPFRVVV